MENNEETQQLQQEQQPVDKQPATLEQVEKSQEEDREKNEIEATNNENFEHTNLTESIVNIQSFPHTQESQHETQNEHDNNQKYEGTNLTESIVDIHSVPNDEEKTTASPRPNSPPPPSDTTELTPDNQITESIIEIKPDEEKNSITQSTLVLTHSQILHDENLQNCAELEGFNNVGEEQKNINTESMIVTNLSSEASSFVSSPITDKPDFVEEEEAKEDDEANSQNGGGGGDDQEEENAQQETTIEQKQQKERDEVDKLVKEEYEIPNFADNILKNEIESLTQEISSKLQEVRGTTEETLKEKLEEKVEKRVENEQYVKILGNDSLQKRILEYGDETVGRPTNGQMVTVSYEAYLKDNLEKLVDHNDNLSFILGDSDVISAMDMVVSLMDKGEKCEMITDSRLAYGDIGKQPDIPSKADLVYKIHLKDFTDLTELNQMTPVERLSLAEAKKLRGNFHYNRQDFYQAINSYKKGLKYFGEDSLRGDEQDEDLDKFLELSQALLMNTALSYFKMGDLRPALETLEQVLNAQKNHIKALYIRGKVLLQMGETEEAVKSLNQAVQLDPSNTDIKKELQKAQAKHKIQYENEKKMYQKMISGGAKSEETKKTKKVKKQESNYYNYLAAGLAVAAASIGVALFARYKNMF